MRPLAVQEQLIKHNAKVKIYPNGKVHITCFSRDIFRDEGWELIDAPVIEVDDDKCYETDKPRSDSLKRAKGKIFDIALSNDWKYMITLTLDGDKIDRLDPKAVIKPFTTWLRHMVERKGLKYLIVPELHEDGAIHFHGLINESLDMVESDTVLIPIRDKPVKISTARRLKVPEEQWRTVYNINNYKFGWSTAVKIDDNVEAVSRYMTKYTCKNFQKIFGQSFFAGGGVNRGLPTYYIDIPYQYFAGQEYKLPENLGGVKYLLLDTNTFDYLLSNDWRV